MAMIEVNCSTSLSTNPGTNRSVSGTATLSDSELTLYNDDNVRVRAVFAYSNYGKPVDGATWSVNGHTLTVTQYWMNVSTDSHTMSGQIVIFMYATY